MRISTINIIQNANPNGIIVNKTITIPIATATKLGGVKPGTNVKVDPQTGELIFELTEDIVNAIINEIDLEDEGGSSVPSNNSLSVTNNNGDVIWTIQLSNDGSSLAFVNTAGQEVLKLSQTGSLVADEEITAYNS